jgi:hypothetical protein
VPTVGEQGPRLRGVTGDVTVDGPERIGQAILTAEKDVGAAGASGLGAR